MRLRCNRKVAGLDDRTAARHALPVQSIAHDALLLEQSIPAFGMVGRPSSDNKYHRSDFRGGPRHYTIRRGGMEVLPRLVTAEHRQPSGRRRQKGRGGAGCDFLK